MDDLSRYADQPIAFIGRYVRAQPIAHGVILAAVLGAVACSIGTQSCPNLVIWLSYGSKG